MRPTTSSRSIASVGEAPAAFGANTYVVRVGEVLYRPEALPIERAVGTRVHPSPASDRTQGLHNVSAACIAAATGLAREPRLTVYPTQLERSSKVSEAREWFPVADPPSRVTIGIAALPQGASAKIDAMVADNR